MVEKIESRQANPIWGLPSQIEQVSRKPITQLPFSFDTIQSDSRKTADPIGEGNAGCNCLHHQLELPQFNPGQYESVMNDLQKAMPIVFKKNNAEQSGQEAQINEVLLFLLYIACMKTRQESSEQNSLLSMESAQNRQKANQELQKQFFQTLDDKISRSKTESALSWVGWGLWGAIACAGVASIALTIMSGGAALPTVLVVANSALSVGQGSVTITQNVLNYQNNKATGEMVEIESKRYLNTEKLHQDIETMKESMQIITDIWKQLIEALNNRYDAATNQ